MKQLRAIAFYLPQYHPIPENDAWLGKGFTEWTNVVKAQSLMNGHYQPHLPSELGFYDLRLPEVRSAQAQLAKDYGIYGFCYYHYWFNGRRLLERPFNEVLSSGEPDFPFCLCWANEQWTRNWAGYDNSPIVKQTYSEEDDLNHIRWLAHAFEDKRYIRIQNKPLMLIYRGSQLPNLLKTTDLWRDQCQKMGIGDIYLCKVESFLSEQGNPQKMGFDAGVEFQPKWHALEHRLRQGFLWRVARKLRFSDRNYGIHRIYEYSSIVDKMLQDGTAEYKCFPCVTPSWDNYSRYKRNALIMLNSKPELYQKWLKGAIEKFIPYSSEENLIFINAWNEWAEGNHLEPCSRWGRSYLDATQKVLRNVRPLASESSLEDPEPVCGVKNK